MIRSRDIFVVVVFGLVFRASIEMLAGMVSPGWDGYYVGLFCDGAMYSLMGLVLWLLSRKASLDANMMRVPTGASLLQAIGLAIVLLAFTLGENALEVLIVSRIDPVFAYSYWNFHDERLTTYPLLSTRVISFLLINAVLAPVLEEVVFRKFLLDALYRRSGIVFAIVVGSLFFTVLHFSSHYYLSTFIFSVVLYIVFIVQRSLILCMVIHAVYNLVAFLHQYYFDIHWTRSVDDISSLSQWTPQLIMLLISTALIVYVVARSKGRIRNAMSDYGQRVAVL